MRSLYSIVADLAEALIFAAGAAGLLFAAATML
jgi:hypothetical protein